jgi:hypothetical protein
LDGVEIRSRVGNRILTYLSIPAMLHHHRWSLLLKMQNE